MLHYKKGGPELDKKLTLIKNLDNSPDSVDEEFTEFKNSLPENTQLSFFDIVLHEDDENWFVEALKQLEEKE